MGALLTTCPGAAGCPVSFLPTDLVVQKSEKTVKVDFQRVLQHALHSWAAYHSSIEIEDGIFVPPLPVFGKTSQSRECLHLGSFGMFLELQKDGTQWVSIRGTQNWSNMVDDLKYELEFTPELNIRAHQGFVGLYRMAWDQLKERLDKKKPIRISGHSLGGAVASLLALKLKKDGYHVVEVVTFGAPKFTDFEGCVEFLRLHIPLLRITNKGDPIPAAPPWPQYAHIGAEVHVHGNDPFLFEWITANQATISEQNAAGQFWTRVKNIGSHSNHYMASYLRHIVPKVQRRDVVLEEVVNRL